ncbi:MAG: thiolase family protein [Gammaproteobacteria bacterium]|nr:thiolase family protein [Gammaproteobacteria bacterium]
MSNDAENNVVIVAAKRTPMGGLLGDFAAVTAPQLGATAIRAVIDSAGIDAALIDEVYMGNVIAAGLKQAPARQASLGAGVPNSVPCTTVNKVCGSGMKAVMIGRDQIAAGSADIVVAGGMESMTGAPYLVPGARAGLRLLHGEFKDSMFVDGLEDASTGGAMGSFAQGTADDACMTREQLDEFALRSLSRANAAIENGYFADEIAPVTVTTRKGDVVVDVDEQPAKARPEKIPGLKPAFKKDGTLTAANSSSISDGASALILMRESTANDRGIKPIARLLAQASFAHAPEDFCAAPLGAMKKVLAQASWSADDVDLFEVNEAFAAVTMLAMQEFEIDAERINVNGGACALGHPLGSSGARLVVTLVHALQRLNKTRGVAALCIGGGEATAMALELI